MLLAHSPVRPIGVVLSSPANAQLLRLVRMAPSFDNARGLVAERARATGEDESPARRFQICRLSIGRAVTQETQPGRYGVEPSLLPKSKTELLKLRSFDDIGENTEPCIHLGVKTTE